MPEKNVVVFTCTGCDAQFQKWNGRCLECGKWGTLTEGTRLRSATAGKQKTDTNQYPPVKMQTLSEIEGKGVQRIPTSIHELDRVLGGGIVPGSLILLGGEPGIGKSTLSLQLASAVSNTLYLSGEESVGQIKLRADRLQTPHGIKTLKHENTLEQSSPSNNGTIAQSQQSHSLRLANETTVEPIVEAIRKEKPVLGIVDSIQTVFSDEVASEPGNPNQIRATVKLLEVAKSIGTAIVIIGHVTKDGSVAGPKAPEHLVDTVLYFEGDRHHALRILRSVKNRFGTTDEVGIFQMQESGLVEVSNPSAALLSERGEAMPGSVLTCLMEGTRPLLVEVQALVTKTSFGYPIRKASGFDLNRLHVLTAVLQKRASLNLAQYDIHLNVVGGLKADEPAADLAVCLAIASAYKDKMLGADLAVFGEVGLGGEVRSVSHTERRIKECEQLGMKRVIAAQMKKKIEGKVNVIGVKNIAELIAKS